MKLNKKANEDFVAAMVGIVVLIIAAGIMISMFHSMSCQNEQNTINDLQGKLTETVTRLQSCNDSYSFLKERYNECLTTNITKEEFQEMSRVINNMSFQLVELKGDININNQYIKNVEKEMNDWRTSKTINYGLTITATSLFSFGFFTLTVAILDWALFAGEFLIRLRSKFSIKTSKQTTIKVEEHIHTSSDKKE
ncbi:MAG: hypothetical protein V1920_06295 [Bacillota bacterium]